MGKFVIKETKSGFKFDLKAGNGEIIASSEVYNALKSAQNGVESVRNNAPIANVEDQTVEGYATEKHPKFEMYTDKAGEYRFRLKPRTARLLRPPRATRRKPAALTVSNPSRRTPQTLPSSFPKRKTNNKKKAAALGCGSFFYLIIFPIS